MEGDRISKNMNPFVSVILAVKNRTDNVRNCLDSWQWQTYHPYEMIIVDDGDLETPPPVPLINYDLGVCMKYIKVGGSGDRTPTVAWNLGFKHAEGDFIIFTNGDMILPFHDTIEKLVNFHTCRRVSLMTYFLTRYITEWATLYHWKWKENPFIFNELPTFWEDGRNSVAAANPAGAAGLITQFSGQPRKDWEWFGLFREDASHLTSDQDVHLREVCLGKGCDTAPDVWVYHQWHPGANVPMSPGYIYRTEAQARLLEPAEREKS
jgi:glycosyltransferase involved in cell wall biosynthesis